MSNRWSPGDPDWSRIIDYGSSAAWVRPETDGVSIAVYAGDGFGWLADQQRAEVWQVRVAHGSSLLDTIRDKLHRIRWVSEQGAGEPSGIVSALCSDFKVISWERIEVPASHHGHPRLNHNRHVWVDPLPRRIRDAIGY